MKKVAFCSQQNGRKHSHINNHFVRLRIPEEIDTIYTVIHSSVCHIPANRRLLGWFHSLLVLKWLSLFRCRLFTGPPSTGMGSSKSDNRNVNCSHFPH